MKQRKRFFIFLVISLLSIAIPSIAEEALKNETIIELTEAGLSETVIINAITKSETSFDLIPPSLNHIEEKRSKQQSN
ncbi:MAG: hypothetical protein WBM78_23890 [Desulfobacterales bacterium]